MPSAPSDGATRAGRSARRRASATRVREPVRQQRRAEPSPEGQPAGRRPAVGQPVDGPAPRIRASRRSTRSPTPSCARPSRTAGAVTPPPRRVAGRSNHSGRAPDAPRSERPNQQPTPPISAVGPLHRVLEGTVIDAVLTNRLDGSAAAPVNCLVTNPLYSHSGQHVLIPAGARVLGETRPVQALGRDALGGGVPSAADAGWQHRAARPVQGAQPDRRLRSARPRESPLPVHVWRGRCHRPGERPVAAPRQRGLRHGRRRSHGRHRRQRRRRDRTGECPGHESVPEPAADDHDPRRAPGEGLHHQRPRPAGVVAGRRRPALAQRR